MELGKQYVREIRQTYGEGRSALDSPLVTTPDVVAHVFRDLQHETVEHVRVMLLNGRHRLMAWYTVSIGTMTASLIHPREVFSLAVQCKAAAIILAHNHPSGECVPSSEDWAITHRLQGAGEILGIPLMDHVVIGEGIHQSMREMPRWSTQEN